MGEIAFYLRKANPKKRPTAIYLRFPYNGRLLKFYIGQSIEPANWNSEKQRAKKNQVTTQDGQHSLNDLLYSLRKECEKSYNEALKDGIPTPDMLKRKLHAFIDKHHNAEKLEKQKPKLFNLIERFILGEIKYKGQDKSPNTIKTYRTLFGHLENFEKHNKSSFERGINFEDINLDFYYKYTAFLKKLGLGQNAISKDIQILKTVMREAVDLRYTDNVQFMNKKFAVHRIDTDAVYLTELEIFTLFQFDLSQNKRLEQVRDLFVFGCFVGLRFSDYSTVKPENIVQIDGDYFIKLITKKTGELVIIPCNPIVLQIFEKYKINPNKLPKTVSNQKFNSYIKEVCKLAGLAEKGRLSTLPSLELWECISSHTARRSFATNFYLSGFPTIDLMKITGHRTERAFLKYIRIAKLDTAKRLNEHIKRNWSLKLLKVAS